MADPPNTTRGRTRSKNTGKDRESRSRSKTKKTEEDDNESFIEEIKTLDKYKKSLATNNSEYNSDLKMVVVSQHQANEAHPPSLNTQQTSSNSKIHSQVNIPEIVLYEENQNCVDTKYIVLVDLKLRDIEENNRKRIYELKLHNTLGTLGLLNGYKSLKRIGFRRCKVEFQTAEDANELVNKNSNLRTHNLYAFIPKTFVYKYGVIKEIPKKMTDDELFDCIKSEIPFRSINRFTRVKSGESNVVLKTNTIKIGFLGNAIPSKVLIHGIPFKVDYYIPRPKSCTRCGRLGHLKNVCKNSKPRCLQCGKEASVCANTCRQTQLQPQKCILCEETNHNFETSTPRNCWKKREQRDIQRIMAIGNLTFNEVKEKHNINPFEILTDQEYEIQFPELKNKTRTSQVRDNQDEINKTLRRHATYQKALATKVMQHNPPNFPQAEPLDAGNQCAFNSKLEKVTEFEKFINGFFNSVMKNAELTNNELLKKQVTEAKNIIQNLSINNDMALIETITKTTNEDSST